MEKETKYGRGRFIRQIGLTLAAAVGAGALAPNAYAVLNCCRQNCMTCTDPNFPNSYFCTCTGIGSDYCTCSHLSANCYSGPC